MHPINHIVKFFGLITLTVISLESQSQTISSTTISGSMYCAGSSITVSYTVTGTFLAGNYFTAQLSDANGDFLAPVDIGSTTTLESGAINAQIPFDQSNGSYYRIRVISSAPVVIGNPNNDDFQIKALGVRISSLTNTSFCQGESFSILYEIEDGCVFPDSPLENTFTAQLSNEFGDFTAPTSIGSIFSSNSGSIDVIIPNNTPSGAGYRIRIKSSNLEIVGNDNGTDLIVNASNGNPSVYGTTSWNAYVYKGTVSVISENTFAGMYTEENLSFDTRDRWGESVGPSFADGSSGFSYEGCPVENDNFSISYKRTNFQCGYYQIDIPAHDDGVRLYIDGILIFDHQGCCDSHFNIHSGFLGPNSEVEIQVVNNFLLGFLKVEINPGVNPLLLSPPSTICPSSSAQLTVNSTLPLSYSWIPTTGLTPPTGMGANVIAAPLVSTTYTVTGIDVTTGCEAKKSVDVTVVSPSTIPTITITNSPSIICSGATTSTLTATGANTYTWSPSTGLNTTTGSTVMANPTTTTTYTVVGSTGCQANSNVASVTVEIPPSSPIESTFGNGAWNVYCYNDVNLNSYYGFYTESNLSFNTSVRWLSEIGPSSANNSSGVAYTGCTIGSSYYSISFKRTNFECNYYQIDIPIQDDALILLIDGIQVFQNSAFEPNLQSNIWTGFLGPTSTVEFRLINFDLIGQLAVDINLSNSKPQILSDDLSICVGTNTEVTANSSIVGATYNWFVEQPEPTITFLPDNTNANPTIQTSSATPVKDYVIVNTLTDAENTGCSIASNLMLSIDAPPNTIVTPTSVTTSCSEGITLTASGASTYNWSPTYGLNNSSGSTVIATPSTSTTYSVTGSNSCSSSTASAIININPLPDHTMFPIDVWNIYGFNSPIVGENYVGFYSENGSGSIGLDFDTQSRWQPSDNPSMANGSSGTEWQGCQMNEVNTSLSFKRTGFNCGIYRINVPAHQNSFVLLINNVEVARHNGCCDNHTNVWTGVLNSNTTVEWQLQLTDDSRLKVSIELVPYSNETTIWNGSINSDWFTAANWCAGIPTSTSDVIIPAIGPQNMPVINLDGAVVNNITINPAVNATLENNFIAPSFSEATLSIYTANLNIFGNWINNGTLTTNESSVSFVGTKSGNTIASLNEQTFYNLVIDNPSGLSIIDGKLQISGNLKLSNGVIHQNSELMFLNGATVSDVSDNSYIEGRVSKTGNTSFVFPVGKSNQYRPISISAPTSTTEVFTAEYFLSNPIEKFNNANVEKPLDKISDLEYWLLERSGNSNVHVTVSWNSHSKVTNDLDLIRVAYLHEGKWLDLGNQEALGTQEFGQVSSSKTPDNYGAFTLASIDDFTVGFENQNNEIVLYPNPAQDHIIIINAGNDIDGLSISNSLGQEINIYYSIESDKITIDTTNLGSGFYTAQLKSLGRIQFLKFYIR